VGPEHLAELEGVRESKKVTDAVALRLAATIRAICPHKVLAIGPEKYNELYARIGNLNKLLNWGHARAIEEVLAQHPCELVISDQFADPAGLKRALFEKGRQVRLESRVRAESDLAVAAASILARAEFLRRLARLSEEIGIELPKGASASVIEVAKRVVARLGRDGLAKVAKLHFKTTNQVLQTAP
jgi:ribonuclease HIII